MHSRRAVQISCIVVVVDLYVFLKVVQYRKDLFCLPSAYHFSGAGL